MRGTFTITTIGPGFEVGDVIRFSDPSEWYGKRANFAPLTPLWFRFNLGSSLHPPRRRRLRWW